MSEALTSVTETHPAADGFDETEHEQQLTELFHGSVEVSGARKFVDYTVEVPEELSTEKLAVLVPGLGAVKRRSRDFRHALAAEQGVMALSFDPARKRTSDSDPLERLFNPQQLDQDTIEAIITDLGHNIALYRSDKGEAVRSAKLTMVPHSKGELSAVGFTFQNPAAVDSFVRVETVGTEGPLGLKLVWRTGEEILFDIGPAIISGKFGFNPIHAWRELEYFAGDPLRTFGDIFSCMTADTRGFTQAFYDRGLYQAYVGGTKDRFFKPSDTIKAVGHLLNYKEIVDISHIGPQIESRLVGAVIGKIIVNQPEN